jgi:hypothetical protein
MTEPDTKSTGPFDVERRSLLGIPLACLLVSEKVHAASRMADDAFAFVSRITPKLGLESRYAQVVEQDIGRVEGCIFLP